MEISLAIIIAMVIIAFLCEFTDATIGMGYGTTLTPVLLLMGFSPIEIVPAILLSELVAGLLAGLLHHFHGNVNFKLNSMDIFKIKNMLSPLGYIDCVRRTIPRHLKVALLLAACSIIGTVSAVLIAVRIPEFWLKIYIGCLVLLMGVIVFVCRNRSFKFSWKKISFLGLIASFNKGISGGGYGPVVTSGQMLSGVETTSAVAITTLAEGLTCLVGVIIYLLASENPFTMKLAPWIMIGAVTSVPFSTSSVRKIGKKRLNLAIAAFSVTLGILTILKTVN